MGTFDTLTPEGKTASAEHVYCWHPGQHHDDEGWCWIPTDDLIPGQEVPGIFEQMGVIEE